MNREPPAAIFKSLVCRKVLRWGTAFGVAAGLLTAAWLYRPSAVVEYLRHEVATAPAAEAVAALSQLPTFGQHGIEVLAEAIGSSRPEVAAGARTVLLQTVDSWAFLSSDDSHPKLVHLLAILAKTSPTLPAAGRNFARSIAMKALQWDFRASGIDNSALLASCETILRSQAPHSSPSSQGASTSDIGDPVVSGREPSILRQPHARPPRTSDLALPGGALPIPLPATSPARPASTSEFELAVPANDNQPVGFIEQPLRLPAEHPARPLFSSTSASKMDSGETAEPEIHEDVLSQVPTMELIRQFGESEPQRQDQVRSELSKRGFGPVEFELASRITNPDPAVRKLAVDVLPKLRVDARPWLIWLSHDEDADVRFAAVGLMATTDEPRMRKRLEELAVSDSDLRVQQIAARVTSGGVRRGR